METAGTPLYRTMVRKPLVEFSHWIRDEILRLKTEKIERAKFCAWKKWMNNNFTGATLKTKSTFACQVYFSDFYYI